MIMQPVAPMPPQHPTYERSPSTTWNDGKRIHTQWEESELFFVDPNSPLAAELMTEMEMTYHHPVAPPVREIEMFAPGPMRAPPQQIAPMMAPLPVQTMKQVP